MRFLAFYFLLVLVASCKDPYTPPFNPGSTGYLSVDANINVTERMAVVRLTNAVSLSSSNVYPIVADATVTIEDDTNNVYAVPYDSNGMYKLKEVDFDINRKYKLRIELADRKKYSSSFITLTNTPAIDSLWWEGPPTGVGIKVDTHGELNDSHYYMWRYTETWEYHSQIPSYLQIVGDQVLPRYPSEQIYVCWKSLSYSKILITSTDGLATNAVDGFQINSLAPGDARLLDRYSILVEQFSLTKEAYTFFSELKKTTENLGGLFDPLPFKVFGNISSDDNPTESVLGYFFGGTVTSRRIFISFSDLPQYLQFNATGTLDCPVVSVKIPDLPNRNKLLVIYGSYGTPATVGYYFSTPECVDCTSRGGTTVKPSFWN